jgi:hypothetical protein
MKRVSLLTIILLIALPLSSAATDSICPGSEVIVASAENAEMESTCDAVRLGDAFLKTLGLKISTGLTITLYNELPRNGQQHSIGYYDSCSNEIRILNYDAVLKFSTKAPPAFGVMLSKAIWCSYVVHELAHAESEKQFSSGVPKCTASEYIASVAQLATLPPAELAKIVSNYADVSGFDKKEEITMAFYMLDPSRFSVNAFLHYLKPENGPGFIKRLLHEGLSDD